MLLRIPVRTNNDDRYFTDPWQAIPSHGYTRIFENMFAKHADKITIRTGVDFFAPGVKEALPKRKMLVFTGPIDAYYASLGMPKLEYRSLRFEEEYHEPEGGFYQEALQVRPPVVVCVCVPGHFCVCISSLPHTRTHACCAGELPRAGGAVHAYCGVQAQAQPAGGGA